MRPEEDEDDEGAGQEATERMADRAKEDASGVNTPAGGETDDEDG